jgi:hypothetical protein
MFWRFEETLKKKKCLSGLILLLDFFKSCSGTCVLLPALLDTRDVNADNPLTFQDEISFFWVHFSFVAIYNPPSCLQ